MITDESAVIDLDEDGTKITDLLERAERSLRISGDDKYYVTIDELFLLASQGEGLDRPTKVEKGPTGDWIVEIFFDKKIFINVSPFLAFSGRQSVKPVLLN